MNIAGRLEICAKNHPDKKAVVFPEHNKGLNYSYSHLTFKELQSLTDHYANKLQQVGFKKGDRTLLFIRPSLDFPALVFALFKMGIIPVLIDPGMGKDNLLKAITKVQPQGLIAVNEVHIARLIFREPFKNIKHFVTSGKLRWGKMHRLCDLKADWDPAAESSIQIEDIDEEELAAILFTSGGTGIPKGVEYTHKIFSTQTDQLQQIYNLTENDVDLPGFPLFSLFTIAMGMTSCIPDMNPAKPSSANPAKLVQNIIDHKATFAAGSPSIWIKVANYCIQNKITLPSLKYLVMFGAPIPWMLHQQFKKILSHGTTFTPYGATESLPVANISGEFLLQNTVTKTKEGKGTCVGKPLDQLEFKIIEAHDEIISHIGKAKVLPVGTIGEIIVSGNVVTKKYYSNPLETLKAKIYDEDGKIWHRMGDMGYLDDEGLLWFCGRKSHRVVQSSHTSYSITCEAIVNNHPEVYRCALIGNKRKLALVIERKDKKILTGFKREQFEEELISMCKQYPHTQRIETFFFHKNFPVDVRHNIKIDRLALRDQFLGEHK